MLRIRWDKAGGVGAYNEFFSTYSDQSLPFENLMIYQFITGLLSYFFTPLTFEPTNKK